MPHLESGIHPEVLDVNPNPEDGGRPGAVGVVEKMNNCRNKRLDDDGHQSRLCVFRLSTINSNKI